MKIRKDNPIFAADIICVIGASGSGKSTLAKEICCTMETKKLFHDYNYFSVGQEMRAIHGDKKWHGELGDESIVRSIIKSQITSQDNLVRAQHVVLDGVPRTPSQALWLIEEFPKLKMSIINLNVGFITCLLRFLKRGRKQDGIMKFFVEYVRHYKIVKFLTNDKRFNTLFTNW